jgi:hypothetical protein
MNEKRISVRELKITASEPSLAPATVMFKPGLNLVIGASSTGKTFVFEAIDFMLGARALRRIPESGGYSTVDLLVEPSDGAPFTLRRAFDGGNFELYEYANGRDQSPTKSGTLSTVHSAEPESSLSAYLLKLVGIGNRQVRKNVQGEKKALSFRHVCHLTLISEEHIIQQSTPVLSDHDTENTAEANVFAYFLTGSDDSAIIPQENSKSRKARLEAEESLLEKILDKRRSEFAALSADPFDFTIQASKLDEAIEVATQTIVSSQAEISELERTRCERVEERVKHQSRLIFIQEQLKRLRLLGEYYRTDKSRLQAVIEASRVLHDLPEGTCPLCHQQYPTQPDEVPTHEAFEDACSKEVDKIDVLQADLAAAIVDFATEEGMLKSFLQSAEQELAGIEERLHSVLQPSAITAKTELQQLIQTRTTLAQGATLHANILDLEERLKQIEQAQSEKVSKPIFAPRATTSSASEFCKVVEEILRAWKYPDAGTVAFDTDKSDLVIAGKDRANTGKGYRAITYAAFTIGLMKYCRLKNIPHPGLVILDTPLNPYKGPISTLSDMLSDEVKDAFFRYLADDTSGDQYIIMENDEPPVDVRERVTYYDFTHNPALGRFGFFPLRPNP